MSMTTTQTVRDWSRRPAFKLFSIGALLLALLLPSTWVDQIIGEREARQDTVRDEIALAWGPSQRVIGPILVVPYLVREPGYVGQGGQVFPPTVARHYAHIVPSRLAVNATLSPEQRRRGLFAAVVYSASVKLEGSVTIPAIAVPGSPDAQILWAESFVAAGASDLRAWNDAALHWNGTDLQPSDSPPAGSECGAMSFMSWTLPSAIAPGQTLAFSTAMDLRGTGAFHVVPASRQMTLEVSAAWPTPSFTGTMLPRDSTVTDKGFAASWQDGGGARQAVWFANTPMTCGGPASTASAMPQQDGVDLLEAVPTYRMVNRTAKYVLLFLALSFLTYFLFETLSRVAIHPIQYGLIGLSVCLFPLLLLAIAEPLGFAAAYMIAAGAIVIQASLFTWSVTKRARLASLFAAMSTAVFGFQYVVLSLESFSLLAGAVALFLILSIIMAATRRVDWAQTS